jgi:hypothetical protein
MLESKKSIQTIKSVNWYTQSSSLEDVNYFESIISKEIGIPVAVQGRKNSILCLSGQAPRSLAKHCKNT